MINNIKIFFHKIISLFGYKLFGKKDIVKHNSFNAIHRFIFEKIAYVSDCNKISNKNSIIYDVKSFFPRHKVSARL